MNYSSNYVIGHDRFGFDVIITDDEILPEMKRDRFILLPIPMGLLYLVVTRRSLTPLTY